MSGVYSAPGKAFLLGEYAVLEGVPALVAAVSCRARGSFVVGASPSSPLIVEATRAVSGAEALAARGAVVVDTRAFVDERGRKLGTGSSAAAAAVAVAVVQEEVGAPQAEARTEDDQRSLFILAHRAHRASQGGVGSGADVAAAVYGGVVRFVSDGGGEGAPQIRRMSWPANLEVAFFSAPVSASTPAFIAGVKAYAQRHSQGWAAHLAALREHAEGAIAAFEENAQARIIEHVAGYGARMAELGRDAQLPIVISAFAEAATLAQTLGGAAKPSGAGGGDIGVAIFADAASRRTFSDRLARLGLAPLAVGLDLAGTVREAAASHERTNV